MRRAKCWLLVGTIAWCGCGPETMPKGTGASGQVTEAAPSDLGADLINNLTPEQQKSMEWLHHSFDQAAKVRDNLSEQEAEQLEKIKSHWSSIVFARTQSEKPAMNINGEKNIYLAMIETDLGNLELQFIGDYAPDHVRSFATMAELGMFDGRELSLGEDLVWLGPADEKPLFELESAYYPTSLRPGMLIAPVTEEGKTAGTRFAIRLSDKAAPNATTFGGTMPTNNALSLDELKKKLQEKPGSVKIKSVRVQPRTVPLFQSNDQGNVSLPSVGPDGKPVTTPAGIPKEVADQLPKGG